MIRKHVKILGLVVAIAAVVTLAGVCYSGRMKALDVNYARGQIACSRVSALGIGRDL